MPTIKLRVYRLPEVSEKLIGTIKISPEAETIVKQLQPEIGLSCRSIISNRRSGRRHDRDRRNEVTAVESKIPTDCIRVKTVPVIVLAKMIGVDPNKIKSAIKNGTMPVGCVCQSDGSSRERTVIIKTRLERWLAGEL
ncbi:MAG: hypothetical protein AAGU74_03445 [Bacillota bacterium]